MSKDPEYLFDLIKRYQRVMVFAPILAIGSAVAIMILNLYPLPSGEVLPGGRVFNGWYAGVLGLLLITIIPVVLLIAESGLRKIHIAVRLDVIYRYLFFVWMVFFSTRVMVSIYHAVYWFPYVVARNLFLGIFLAASYVYLKRRYTEKPETMFP